MVDYLLGLVLMMLGIKQNPLPANVLGETTTAVITNAEDVENEQEDGDEKNAGEEGEDASGAFPTKPPRPEVTGNSGKQRSEGLKVMRPKFSPKDQEAFQAERKKREENLRRVSEVKLRELARSFDDRQKERIASDDATRKVLTEKAAEFKDVKRRQKLVNLSTKFQETVTKRLNGMQRKLESMSSLLDRINAAAGALKAQGVDVSEVEADIPLAQTKISNAVNQLSTLAASVPTAFSVNSETTAKSDVEAAIESVKQQIEPAKAAFEEAREAVGKTLSDLEEITDAVQVGVWPEKK